MPFLKTSRQVRILRQIITITCLVAMLSSCLPFVAEEAQAPEKPQPTLTPTIYITATPAPTFEEPPAFQEAPVLAAQVQSGSLPPVSERLPLHPKVVPVTEQVGTYGGTWRLLIQPRADEAMFVRTVAYEPLVRWTKDWSGIEPNLAEWYSVNSNATEYTFRLRRDLRWSDGLPFTTADIRFWYENILQDAELTPLPPAWLKSRGQVVKFEFLDDVTFKVYFPFPNSLFLQQLATPEALMITAYQEQYARQFHRRYASPGMISALMRDGGYQSWAEMFSRRVGLSSTDTGNFSDANRPRMFAWVLKTAYTPGASVVRWERNPYYWKVDSQGNQLPYLDAVDFQVVQNMDDAVTRVIAGDIDMQNISAMGMDSDAILKGAGDQGYRRYSLVDSANNVMVIHLNMAHKDPVKRAIFRSKDFRIALSYAINRQEILDILFGGTGVPWQAAPRPESPFYNPQMGLQFTDFDLQKANQFLDSAGFKKDQVGNRLGPDNLPITFTIDVLETQPQQIAMLNMIAKYWADIGIRVQPRISPLPLFLATVRTNGHDAAAFSGGATLFDDILLNPSDYLPSSENTLWAVTWANWFNRVPGYESQQPDAAARKSFEMYDLIHAARDPAEQMRLMKGALLISRESFWTIGIALGPEKYGLVRKNFKNVPEKMPDSWMYPDPAPTNPEQYFIATAP